MLSRDDFRFVLLPWEHPGAQFDARPDFVTTAQVNGIEQMFLLKVRANRVFFRLAEDETRVWATLGEVDDEVVSFWQKAVQERLFGRLFSRRVRLGPQRYEETEMAALVGGEAQLWLCEWCSDVWWRAQMPLIGEKYLRTHRKLGVWHPQWKPPLRKLFNRNLNAICHRPMPVDERERTALRWVCGSAKQLEELLQSLCLVHLDTLSRQTEAHFQRWTFRPGSLRFSLTSDSFNSEANLRFDWEMRRRDRYQLFWMLDVFLAHNRVAGVDWEYGSRVQQGGAIRGDWRQKSFVRSFEFARQQPTSQQKDQARLHLRDWLRDKAPEWQLETWLAPNQAV